MADIVSFRQLVAAVCAQQQTPTKKKGAWFQYKSRGFSLCVWATLPLVLFLSIFFPKFLFIPRLHELDRSLCGSNRPNSSRVWNAHAGTRVSIQSAGACE